MSPARHGVSGRWRARGQGFRNVRSPLGDASLADAPNIDVGTRENGAGEIDITTNTQFGGQSRWIEMVSTNVSLGGDQVHANLLQNSDTQSPLTIHGFPAIPGAQEPPAQSPLQHSSPVVHMLPSTPWQVGGTQSPAMHVPSPHGEPSRLFTKRQRFPDQCLQAYPFFLWCLHGRFPFFPCLPAASRPCQMLSAPARLSPAILRRGSIQPVMRASVSNCLASMPVSI